MTIFIRDKMEFLSKLAKKGYTQLDLSEKIPISTAYLNSIINGRSVGVKTSRKICEILGVDFDDIFLLKNITNVK